MMEIRKRTVVTTTLVICATLVQLAVIFVKYKQGLPVEFPYQWLATVSGLAGVHFYQQTKERKQPDQLDVKKEIHAAIKDLKK